VRTLKSSILFDKITTKLLNIGKRIILNSYHAKFEDMKNSHNLIFIYSTIAFYNEELIQFMQ
jgi:monomeric isocitrate dehydrogenase